MTTKVMTVGGLFLMLVLSACAHHVEPEELKAPPTSIEASRFHVVPSWGIPLEHEHDHDQGVGPTHGGVVVDAAGSIYVSSDSGIYIFDHEGNLEGSLEGGPFSHLHAMTISMEDGVEYIYGAGYKRAEIVKFTTEGDIVLRVPFPKESGVKGNYVPTAVAVAPSGNILVADGYGTNVIFEFDKKGNYLSSFGGKSKDDVSKFTTPHGIAIDTRYDPARLLISDREKRRLVHYTLDGVFMGEVITGLRRPCAVSISGGNVAIAELEGRVALLNKNNRLVGVLGDNPNKAQWANYGVKPADWKLGIFTAPHGLSWDHQGNLYVQDWSSTGRISKWQYQ
ncbi:MAG: hypothetical protein ACI97A_003104 [Planctomycetota bacterium]|jgi:hypothetical protein